jgi:4-diphosphocytidyl-2-C-methyl-D-erythritol kinase
VELWQLNISPERLQSLALTLGSDVPMCYVQKPAFVAGVGEQITPWSLAGAEVYVVLAHPRKPLLTVDVYRRFKGHFDAPMAVPMVRSCDALIQALTPLHNALQEPALQVMPEIGAIIDALAHTPHCALARMTGSGAGCFGLYATQQAAQHAAESIRTDNPHWWCVATVLEA